MTLRPHVTFTGIKRLDHKLNRINKRDAGRIGRKAGRRGVSLLAKEIKSEAPVGKTRDLRRSTGSRFRKKRKQQVIEAKAGPNVAKKKDKQTSYGHVVAIKSGYVDRATAKVGRGALELMTKTVREEIKKLK